MPLEKYLKICSAIVARHTHIVNEYRSASGFLIKAQFFPCNSVFFAISSLLESKLLTAMDKRIVEASGGRCPDRPFPLHATSQLVSFKMNLSSDHDIFAASLVRDWADYQAREAANSRQMPANEVPEIPREVLRKMALLRSEVLHVSASISLVTSISNRLFAKPDRCVPVRSLTAFKPCFSSMSKGLAAGLVEDAAFFSFAQLWQMVHSRLAFALNVSEEVVRQAEASGSEFDSDDCEMAADSWQRVCRAVLRLHTEIAEQMAVAGLVCDHAVERPVLSLLRAAAEGNSPCLDSDGRMSVPGWAERRIDPRRELNMLVCLIAGSVTCEARLYNASCGGLALACSTPVPQGTPAIVTLPSSRELAGFVSWAKAGRLGVKLARRLGQEDQLLTGV